MTEPTEPESPTAGPSSDRDLGPDPASVRPRRLMFGLPGRTLAICVCVAIIGALAAALATTMVLGDGSDGTTDSATLEPIGPVDPDRLLSVGLVTLDGKDTALRPYLADQPLVVNIWAQSCVPCVDEMPLLEQAHQDNPDLDFLGVDTQDVLSKAEAMARQTGITYPWVQDPTGNFYYEARAAGMPTTLLVAPSGDVLASKTGAFKSQSDLQDWLEDHRS